MYLTKFEINIVKSLDKEWEAYYKMFGKRFPPYNRDEWFPIGDKYAVDVWKDTLLECLKTKTPFKSPYETEK